MDDNQGSKVNMVGSDSNGDNKGNWYSFQHDDWVISTRAEHHVCHDIDLLKNVRCVQGFALTLPNGDTLPALKMGDVDLHGIPTLKNVLYVPEYRVNLVSVCELTASGELEVQLGSGQALIQEI